MEATQLLVQGVQDVWLTGDPKVSFYRSSYKQHTPYAASVEQFNVPMDGRIHIASKSDLIGYTYLTAHDPSTDCLIPNLDWSTVISSVDLVIGNQTIATHDMTYINTIQRVLESETWSKTTSPTAFQPLGFFFDKQYLPIVALRYADVQINISPGPSWSSYRYKCWVSCVYLDDLERRFFTEKPFQMLIPQLQRRPIQNEPPFYGPIKYIAAPCVNYSNVYTPPFVPPVPPVPPGMVQWGVYTSDTGIYGQSYSSVDSSGDVYFSGVFNTNPLSLYNSDGTAFGTTLPNSDLPDGFIAKYDTNGNVLWCTRIEGISTSFSYVTNSSDTYGNLYVSGSYENQLTFYNSDGTAFGTTLPISSVTKDVFVAKYDTNGNVLWCTRIAGIDALIDGKSIYTDTTGNVYICGQISGVLDVTLYNSDGTLDSVLTDGSGFIVKYNINGTVEWRVKFTEATDDIKIDISDNVYVSGYIFNTMTLYNSDDVLSGISVEGTGSYHCYIVKYDIDGTPLWGARFGPCSTNYKSSCSVDNSGNIYATSSYNTSTLTLYNSDGTAFGTTLPNSGSFDCVIAKYDTNGNVLWGTRIAGIGEDRGFDISTDSTGNVYVTGAYQTNPVTLYNSDGTSYGTLPIEGFISVFIVKYDTNGNVLSAARTEGLGISTSITTDISGNVYLTGYYIAPLTLYNSDGTTFGELPFTGTSDYFIVKYSAF